jgi:fucose permease
VRVGGGAIIAVVALDLADLYHFCFSFFPRLVFLVCCLVVAVVVVVEKQTKNNKKTKQFPGSPMLEE